MADRPQNKNLVPLNERTPEERAIIQSMGGKACQEKRRQARAVADLARAFSDLPISDGRVRNKLKRLGVDPDDLNNKMAMVVALGKRAMAGDVFAFEKFMELLGEDDEIARHDAQQIIISLDPDGDDDPTPDPGAPLGESGEAGGADELEATQDE